MVKTVQVKRVWLDAITELAGDWPVSIDAQLPQNAEIVDVALAWREFEDPAEPGQLYPCVRYVEDETEAPKVSRVLYAIQDGGARSVPDNAEHLGVVQWSTTPTAVHLFGVRGPVDAQEATAPAE